MPPKVISTFFSHPTLFNSMFVSLSVKLMHSNVLSADVPYVAERAGACELGSMLLKVSSSLLNGKALYYDRQNFALTRSCHSAC